MSSSIKPNNPSIKIISKSHFVTQPQCVSVAWPVTTKFCDSLRVLPSTLVARANLQGTPDVPLEPAQEHRDDKGIISKGSNGGGAPIPDVLSMAKWFLGSSIMIVPFYQNFLKLEATIETNTTSMLHMVEKVAETVDEVVEDVEKSLHENSRLKKIAQRVDKIVEEVDKDAKVLESSVEKVDEMVEKLDAMVEPIIEDKNDHRRSRKTEKRI